MVHRSNPIPETLEYIDGFGTLCIYRTPSSNVYQMRCYLGRIIKRSAKTDKRSTAIAQAKEFYHDCLQKKANHEPLTSHTTFTKAVEDLLNEERARVKRGDRKASLTRDGEYITAKLTEHFSKYHIKDIDFEKIQDYVRSMESNLSPVEFENSVGKA
jgi:hypothetical protein